MRTSTIGAVACTWFVLAANWASGQTSPTPAGAKAAQDKPAAEKPAGELKPTDAKPTAEKPGGEQKASEAKPVADKPAAPAAKPGPKLLDLRYDEDFSYLDGGADSYQADFFDPIKNIHLGDDWRLNLGGEVRFRMEAETNKSFGARDPTQDTFTLQRYLLHADLKYRKVFRVFVQGIAAFDEERDLPRRGIDENRGDLHQLFFDARILGEDNPLTLRVGRQELSYGAQRFVSPLDWAMVRRRFDGVKLFARTENWDVDFWYVKPIPVQRDQHDRYDEDVDFYGLYTTYKGIARHGIDFYSFAIDDTGNLRNPNGRSGDRDVYTLGSRFWGKTAGFDYEAELAGQWGHWAHHTVQAWSWTLDGGYTLDSLPWTPRLGAGFDWASGDERARDGKVGTFNQLYPLGHKYFGFLDVIGRQNVTSTNVNLGAWPIAKKVQAGMAYHVFWLNADRDATYDAGGAVVRRDVTGIAGKEIGHELDVTLTWKVDVHSNLLFGWSHLWDSDFIIQTGPSEDADLFYVQYAMKF